MKQIQWTTIVGLLVIAGILGALGYNWHVNHANTLCQQTTVYSPDKTSVTAELALTPHQQTIGLSNRSSLPQHHGMLFIFPTSGIYPFWMKNTLIPLDIIWINNGTIVDRTTLGPETSTNIPEYTPKSEADAVLELNKGEADELHFTLGSNVTWQTCWK